MDLQHIRAFVAVAREGNLTRAASRLHLTQPAVSVQLRNFQEALGLTLFVRKGQGLTLTADGAEILQHAERVLAAVAHLQQRAGSMQFSMRGELSVGTTLSPEVTRLGAFLQKLVEMHPQVRIKLHHGMSGWVLEQIGSGKLEAGFYIGQIEQDAAAPRFHVMPLTVVSYYVIAPKGWKDKVADKGWAELSALPWIWSHPHSVHNRLLTERFDVHGVKPNIAAEANVEASMLDMVRSGIGLSLARDLVALRESQATGLVVIRDLPLQAELSFVTLANRKNEILIDTVLGAVRAAFQ
jgi:DNA-binding transcriptional LysR family regulator